MYVKVRPPGQRRKPPGEPAYAGFAGRPSHRGSAQKKPSFFGL
jgi:hypothetical protein